MYQLNSKTKVDKTFKVSDLLKKMKADKSIKAEAALVDAVILEHIINPDTIHTKNSEECKEIYVFRIKLKERQVPEQFLKKLDESIHLHTYFLLEHEGEIKELGIYREVKEEQIKRGKWYQSDWQGEKLETMPYCGSIKEVYEQLMMSLVPLETRENEGLKEFLERYTKLQRLEKELSIIENKAQKEKQPRKKLELGRTGRKIKEELNQLK